MNALKRLHNVLLLELCLADLLFGRCSTAQMTLNEVAYDLMNG